MYLQCTDSFTATFKTNLNTDEIILKRIIEIKRKLNKTKFNTDLMGSKFQIPTLKHTNPIYFRIHKSNVILIRGLYKKYREF